MLMRSLRQFWRKIKSLRRLGWPMLIPALVVISCMALLLPMTTGLAEAYTQGPLNRVQRAQAASVLHPFWKGSHMRREPILFIKKRGAALATARLLFIPTHIIRIASGNGRIVYKPGRDYIWHPGTNLLIRPAKSRIAFKTWAQLHPPLGAPDSYGAAIGGKRNLFFVEGGAVFHRLQVDVTYNHVAHWAGYVPHRANRELARTIARLKAKKPLNIVVLGDSISAGACASEYFNQPPHQPPFTILTAEGLRARYGDMIRLENLSVGGMVSTWGVTMAPKVAADKPNLVIIGFGMNDATAHMPASQYIANTRKIMGIIRKKCPKVDFILIATMTANPDWTGSQPALYTQYARGLTKLTGPGVALANMTAMWRSMLKIKKFDDITGNGINHPDDFAHRVYAQVLLTLLR